jgi:hypothetical protein
MAAEMSLKVYAIFMTAWLWMHGCRTIVTSRSKLHGCMDTWMLQCKAACEGCMNEMLHECNAAGMKGSMNARLQRYKAA